MTYQRDLDELDGISTGDVVELDDGSTVDVVKLHTMADGSRWVAIAWADETETVYPFADVTRVGDSYTWEHDAGDHDDEAEPGCERCAELMSR